MPDGLYYWLDGRTCRGHNFCSINSIAKTVYYFTLTNGIYSFLKVSAGLSLATLKICEDIVK